MKSHARVVIIGGGILGVSLLYHLSKLGWGDAALIEKNELTAGSTWHAAGLCTHFAHNMTIQAFRAHSVRLYSGELEKETGSPVSFHRSGALRITRSRDRMDEFRHVQGIGRYSGYDFNILTPDELKEIYPLVELDGLVGAIHEPDDGHVDPSQATHAMALGARTNGASIYRQTKVTGVECLPGGEWRIDTDNGSITAEHVVNAAGTWGYEIGRMFGLDLPIVPMLHQYLVTDRIEAVAARETELPIIRDPEESWYVRQERDGMIIGPYERDGKAWSIDAVPPEFGMELLAPDLDAIEHIVSAAMVRVPALGEAGIKTIVNGPITFTPDANPLIGPAFGLDNAWLLTGSSMGVMEGGGAGKFLAEWMVGDAPPMDALAVDSRRFGPWADRDYRIAKSYESFGNQFAVHYPYEERVAGRPRRMSAIHQEMEVAGASLGVAYGWERPNWFSAPGEKPEADLSFNRTNWFSAVADECRITSEAVAIADLSPFAKFEVSGHDAFDFIDTLGANRAPSSDDRIVLTHTLTPWGGVASEFTVTRLAYDRFYLTSAAIAERIDETLLRQHAGRFSNIRVENLTTEWGILGVMGPHARQVLESAGANCENLPWLTCKEMNIAGEQVRVLRLSYVGEPGFELHLPMTGLKAVYDAIMQAGRTGMIAHYGAYAMNAMRLEKAYPAWGMDLSTERNAFEAGLDRFIKLDGHEFIGRNALIQLKDREPALELKLLELQGKGDLDPFGMHPVISDGHAVGLITSGAYGHRTGKKLAFAYLRQQGRVEQAALIAEICGSELDVKILNECPYDPENLKLRGNN